MSANPTPAASTSRFVPQLGQGRLGRGGLGVGARSKSTRVTVESHPHLHHSWSI
jgi:hypothetical protein